jgi:hypothetical protein
VPTEQTTAATPQKGRKKMKPTKKITASKDQLCAALAAFIGQRSGIEFGNYQSGDWKHSREIFNQDYRPILRRGRQARELLRFVRHCDSITAEMLIEGTRAYSGRLQFIQDGAEVRVDYCTGQYFPTEYRAAACAVLASCLWDWLRRSMPAPDGKTTRGHGVGVFHHETEHDSYSGKTAGEWIRAAAAREFCRSIAREWFN